MAIVLKSYFPYKINSFYTAEVSGLPVSRYYAKRDDRKNDTNKWSYVAEGITLLKRNVIDFNKWIDKSLKNDQLVSKQLDFILDTLKFIKTGRRDISINNWFELLESEKTSQNSSPISKETIDESIKKVLGFNLPLSSFENIVSLWCSNYNGFDDMLCFLNIAFGVHAFKEPVISEAKVTTSDMFT